MLRLITLKPLLIFLICSSSATAHDFYVSLCEINYNRETSSLEVAVKIFSDDLEAALSARGVSENEQEADSSETNDVYIDRYLRRCIRLQASDAVLNWEYLGSEAELDVVWCYLEISGIREPAELTITNKLLTDIYEEQLNIVHVNVGNHKKSLLLSLNTPTKTIRFSAKNKP